MTEELLEAEGDPFLYEDADWQPRPGDRVRVPVEATVRQVDGRGNALVRVRIGANEHTDWVPVADMRPELPA